MDRAKANAYLRAWRKRHPDRVVEINRQSQIRRTKRHREQGVVVVKGLCKCLTCGLTFRKEEALGFRYRTHNTGVCDECQVGECG